MGSVTLFLISAARSVIEMLGLCLVGQGILYLLAGRNRADNYIYQFFVLITKAPRKLITYLLPASTGPVAGGVFSFVILLFLWLGLALLRKSI